MKKKKNNVKIYKPSKISLYLYMVILGIILGFGILNILFRDPTLDYQEDAEKKCVELCRAELSRGNLLETGPCLSEEIMPGWACDVVHSPRVSFLDDHKDNMCKNISAGKTKYVVEVTKTCALVKSGEVSIIK